MTSPADPYALYQRRLHLWLALYVAAVAGFVALMAWAEQAGLSRRWVGPAFLLASVLAYACIGIYCRTTDPEEYYVAGRRVPPMYNGMATAADWMSAASFISLSGGLYLHGYGGTGAQPGGLAYVMGWTGGFVLVALLVAPYLRRHRLYTLPDYFALRYGGRWPRLIAALAVVLCSFTYLVAQIYGVGLIGSRLTGVQFEVAVLFGLGGVLLCSFLGGMRAITWTQVSQYVILVLAFLVPVSWLAYKQMGNPLAPLVYGQQMEKIAALERKLQQSPAEQMVRDEHARRAAEHQLRLQDPRSALIQERTELRERIRDLKASDADTALIAAASRELSALPTDGAAAREFWLRAAQESRERSQPLGGLPPHAEPYPDLLSPLASDGRHQADPLARRNFLALVLCLMLGTLGMPHLLTRFYSVPSVAAARSSVAWSLFFIALLYIAAPALAVMVKYEVMQQVVGSSFESLPAWIGQWAKVDPALLSVEDINGDGVLQFGELNLGADAVMLAMPEIAGLPYVISGLVAAGGLAAALSTADALLLALTSAIVRDTQASPPMVGRAAAQRVIASKFVLLAVAVLATAVAASRPAAILPVVAASFSIAAAAFVPAMVLGIFWPRATRAGAVAGMLAGLAITLYYVVANSQALRTLTGEPADAALWFGIQPISAGLFGVAAGSAAIVVVSLLPRVLPSLPPAVVARLTRRKSD